MEDHSIRLEAKTPRNTAETAFPRTTKEGARNDQCLNVNNRNKVLKRLPTANQPLDVAGTEWCNAFEESIKNIHENRTQPIRQTRKKKNRVPPGKPIRKAAIEENTPEEHEGERAESTSTQDIERDCADNFQKTKEKGIGCEDNQIQENVENDQSLNLEDFVLCNFIYNQGTKKESIKKFVCQISGIPQDNNIEVKCMRYNCQFKCYVFPTVPDISIVARSQIAKKLTNPANKRGRYFFSNLDHNEL